MARPLRFRYAPWEWSESQVKEKVYTDLDQNLGAVRRQPWFKSPPGYTGDRFEMNNGDIALFAWNDTEAYWLGNTETPKALWRTDKHGFDAVDDAISRWATRELTAQLHVESPWLEPYPHLSWFFLPVFLSKDGRETTRTFFKDHAAGFPDAACESVLEFYEAVVRTRILDQWREVMAGKLGTSEYLDLTRMTAAMGEFNVAYLLDNAGYDIEPEITVSTGHAIDYRAKTEETATLAEVTRPTPTAKRTAGTPIAAVRDTARTKSNGQLRAHGGEIVLFVDCSSFPDNEWRQIIAERPSVHHQPAVVYRLRPSGHVSGYMNGDVPLELSDIG